MLQYIQLLYESQLEITPEKVVLTSRLTSVSPLLDRTYKVDPYGIAKPQRFGTLVKALFRNPSDVPDRVRAALRPLLRPALTSSSVDVIFDAIKQSLLWVWADIKSAVDSKPAFLAGQSQEEDNVINKYSSLQFTGMVKALNVDATFRGDIFKLFDTQPQPFGWVCYHIYSSLSGAKRVIEIYVYVAEHCVM